MISDDRLPELKDFRSAERGASLCADPAFARLVVATDNERSPVHRWFKFKESFSKDLLAQVLAETHVAPRRPLRLLDPFCGVGTTLVAAQELGAASMKIEATGIEYNPFIAFVARSKVRWPLLNVAALRNQVARLSSEEMYYHGPLPALSSVKTGLCISKHVSRRLLAFAAAIRRGRNEDVANALLVGLAAAIEPLSRVRKDGRALRLVEKDTPAVQETLKAKWKVIADDAELYQQLIASARVPDVLHGDGRDPVAAGIEPASLDLIVTSPPYPNNIDYTEVYKLELFLLGFLKTHADFYALRSRTFRSHPTSLIGAAEADFLDAVKRGTLKTLLGGLLARTGEMSKPWRQRLVLNYCSDIWTSLRSMHRCLRPGAAAVIVVGNSLHGGAEDPYVIPTDLVVSTIGQRLGFSVERTLQARALKRRLTGNHFLRESVVVLRKRHG